MASQADPARPFVLDRNGESPQETMGSIAPLSDANMPEEPFHNKLSNS